ncbi:protein artichoke [Atheta coriaria]|uniref:protein artichoke n=1 Tax=Dalotia coriaria TaxID=877792 RepID=UPI0031F37976
MIPPAAVVIFKFKLRATNSEVEQMQGARGVRGLIMSTLLLSLLGVSSIAIQQCAVWREIAPCTCKKEYTSKISVTCMKMESFGQVVSLLQNKFQPKDRIILSIGESNLSDLGDRSFKELNMTIEDLKLNHNELSELTSFTFSGLQHVSYMSLADNPIPDMPVQVFEMMPKIKTLDIGRMHLKKLPEESFRSLPLLDTLVLPGNQIYRIDTHAIPPTTIKLHLARNAIRDLNGSLRHLTDLQWLFLNTNELTSLDGELPINGIKILMLHAANNSLTNIPQDIKAYPNLDNLFLQNNLITALDGALSKSRKLERVHLENNRISRLLPDDFEETENLQVLELQNNLITSLNSSLLPLKRLRSLNLTHNMLNEFSWHEVRTLTELRHLDLSSNKIRHLSGMTPNMVEWETKLTNLRLDNNQLHSLNGALSGLRSLLRLNLSCNSLSRISPDDLIGLDSLTMLDISHNQLTTLEETSKTFLPALQELLASDNYLTMLDKDFHGLPVLCWADLSNNQIVALGRDLVSKTHCRIHDGVHESNFGTLKIYLKDNPILCDAALPEITSSMEVNHTKIVGVSHCPPLSEQPVTSKPNAFLGYIPEVTTPQTVLPIQNEPIYKVESNNDARNLQDLNYPSIGEHEFVPMRHGKHLHRPLDTPLPYQKYNNPNHVVMSHAPNPIQQQQPELTPIRDTYNKHQPETHQPQNYEQQYQQPVQIHEPVNALPAIVPENQTRAHDEPTLDDQPSVSMITELPMKDQAIYTNVDPHVQQLQISELASELVQLRSRVQELQSENARLTMNLRSSLPGVDQPNNPHDNDSNKNAVIKTVDEENNNERIIYEEPRK